MSSIKIKAHKYIFTYFLPLTQVIACLYYPTGYIEMARNYTE